MTPRPIRISSVVLLALLIFCRQSPAQNPGGSQPPGTTSGSGPYKAVMEMDAGLPDHTIYRPEDLSALDGSEIAGSRLGQWRLRQCRKRFQQLPYRHFVLRVSCDRARPDRPTRSVWARATCSPGSGGAAPAPGR